MYATNVRDLKKNPSMALRQARDEPVLIFKGNEPDAVLLILDDQQARKLAAKQGLNFTGTVRLLDMAERRGLIPDAGQAVDSIREKGYRISSDILKQIRRSSRDARP